MRARLLAVISFFCLASGLNAQPVITQFRVPATGKFMNTLRLTSEADAGGDRRALVFKWTILEDETGRAKLTMSDTKAAFLQLWWPSESLAEQLIGAKVTVQLEVGFDNPTELDLSVKRTHTITVDGVNHPPVPRITGTLGTSSARIISGNVVQMRSSESTDADGQGFLPTWGFGATRGGRYLRPPVLYGSEGTTAAFTVPEMTTAIDQKIILTLLDGLHTVSTEAMAYLGPGATAPPPVSGTPVVTVAQPTVTVAQGTIADLQAVGFDSDGEDLGFSWVFLQSGTTVGSAMVANRRISTDSWLSVLSYPTASLAAGSYQFSVQANEIRKIGGKSSEKKFLTLVVVPPGGGTGLNQDRKICGDNTGPSLSYMTPDPRQAAIQLRGGEDSKIDLFLRDYSEASSALGGIRRGISEISWDLSAAQRIGIQGESRLLATADPYEAQASLTLSPGQNASGTANLVAVATDVLGCTNTLTFQISATPAVQNTKPSAKIRYDSGAGYSGAVAGGTVVQVEGRQIQLDAGLSSDDGGAANLQYRWTVSSGGILSSATGVRSTLTLNEGESGNVTVTLTVTDTGSLSDTTTIVFRRTTPNQAPVAKLRYNDGKLYSSPVADGSTIESSASEIQLDAGQSTDDKGSAGLTYSWTVAGGATLSSASGQTTKLTVSGAVGSQVVVTLTATDQGGLSSSTSVTFRKIAPNQAPGAKLRYDMGTGWKEPASSGSTIETTSGAVQLDATPSTDDAGSAGLSFTWSASGKGNLSVATGSATTLTLSADAGSQVTVTLTARDQENLSNTFTVTFKRETPNQAPVAKLRYDTGAGMSQPVETNSTVETGSGQVQLDAGQSTDDQGSGNLAFSWSLSGMGALSAATGATTTLTLPTANGAEVSVTLTATDQARLTSSVSLTFRKVQENQAPVASIRYSSAGGSYLGPFASDQTVTGNSRTVSVDGSESSDDQGVGELLFAWTVSGLSGATILPGDQAEATLTVPDEVAGSVTLTLTVTDKSGLSDSVSLVFQYVASAEKPEAQITSAPVSAEAGADFYVEGSASGGTGPFEYAWIAADSNGRPVELYSTGSRALVFAPLLESVEPITVKVSLVVREGALSSDEVFAEIQVTPPVLSFAQLAVGNINADLSFQTTMVLVNNWEDPIDGEVRLIGNDQSDGWHVRVDGELKSGFPISIPPGGAKKFVLTGDQVEAGWMELVSNLEVTGHLFYQVKQRGTDRIVREVPILATVGRGFRTALDEGCNEAIALALVNLGDEPIRYCLEVSSSDGSVMQTREFTLGPRMHHAQFLNQFFDGHGNSVMAIPESFVGGTLVVRVLEGDSSLAAAIMKTDEGLPLSILPVASW